MENLVKFADNWVAEIMAAIPEGVTLPTDNTPVSVKIKTDIQAQSVADFRNFLKHKREALETERKRYTAPLDQQKKQIMDYVNPLSKYIATVEEVLNQATLNYQHEQREKLEKQQQKLIDKAAAKGSDIVPIINTAPTVPQGVSVRKYWRVRVTDVSLIPREYMIPNIEILEALAKKSEGCIKIAGTECFCEERVAERK